MLDNAAHAMMEARERAHHLNPRRAAPARACARGAQLELHTVGGHSNYSLCAQPV